MNKTWKVVLGVILIFVFGWLSGVICTSIYLHHKVITTFSRGPEGLADAVERPLARGMHLDATQRLKFHNALVAYFKQRAALQKHIQPEVLALNQQSFQDVNAFLQPNQQERLKDNLERLREKSGRNLFGDSASAAHPTPATASATNAPPAKL